MALLSAADHFGLAVAASGGKARLFNRQSDVVLTTLATSGTVLTLSTSTLVYSKCAFFFSGGEHERATARLTVDG